MAYKNKRAKRDSTQKTIVGYFENCGWSVQDLSMVGGGCPDIAIAKRGLTIFIELKSDKGRRAPNQVKWAERWNGRYLWGSNPLALLQVAEGMLNDRERE